MSGQRVYTSSITTEDGVTVTVSIVSDVRPDVDEYFEIAHMGALQTVRIIDRHVAALVSLGADEKEPF